ncbi:MAG: peptidylprolyl isomerase [Lachnospiraceae bacterium]
MKNKWKICLLLFIMAFALTGCGLGDLRKKIVLTTGFAKNEVFIINNISCTVPEYMIYVSTIQEQYESVYTNKIWSASLDGVTLEDNVKEIALAQIAQVKVMNLIARDEKIELSEEQIKEVKEATNLFYDSLSETKREQLGVSKSIIEQIYTEYAIAKNVYEYYVANVNTEISDDEARRITVEHILIKTSDLDENGNRVEYSAEEKRTAYNKALEVCNMAKSGSDFESLIEQYNEDTKSKYSFGIGEMEESFLEASFNLSVDEISDVVETSFGYHIIKCISTFDLEETNDNKIKILEQKKQEAFGAVYESYIQNLSKALNESLWKELTLIDNLEQDDVDFFEIFETVSTRSK